MNDDPPTPQSASSAAAVHAAFIKIVQEVFKQTGLNLHLCDGAVVRESLSRLGTAWLIPSLEQCATQVRVDPAQACRLAATVESLGWHVPGTHPETALDVLASPHAITQLGYANRLLADSIGPRRCWLPACADLRPALTLDSALHRTATAPAPSTWVIQTTGIGTPEGAPRSGTVLWQDHCALLDDPLPACDLIVGLAVLVPMRADLRRRWLENLRGAVTRRGLLWLDDRVLPSARELARGAGWVRMGNTDLWRPAAGTGRRPLTPFMPALDINPAPEGHAEAGSAAWLPTTPQSLVPAAPSAPPLADAPEPGALLLLRVPGEQVHRAVAGLSSEAVDFFLQRIEGAWPGTEGSPRTDLPDALAVAQGLLPRVPCALLVFELDHRADLCTAVGATAAQALLPLLAAAVRGALPPSAIQLRGADGRLATLLLGVHQAEEAIAQARRAQEQVSTWLALQRRPAFPPQTLAAHGTHQNQATRPVALSCAVGMSLLPAPPVGVSWTTHLKNGLKEADEALRAALHMGRSSLRLHHGNTATSPRDRMWVLLDMPQAANRGELALHYQPQIDARNGTLVGMEALLRWHHPEKGLLDASQFVDAADECGLLGELGAWIMDTACRQARRWKDLGHAPVPMAVNVKASQLRQPGFVTHLRQALSDSGLQPQDLALEMEEAAFNESFAQARQAIQKCRDLGLHISIDNFGAGRADPQALPAHLLDQIKIDRSCVAALPGAGAVVVNQVMQLARSMGLRVVAEGVETVAQQQFLDTAGCPVVQGHLHARPMPAAEIERRWGTAA